MSWSVSETGKAAELKERLAPSFAACKESTAFIPHESESVALSEELVNKQLDFLAEKAPESLMQVRAWGSAGVAPEGATWRSYSQTGVTVTQVA